MVLIDVGLAKPMYYDGYLESNFKQLKDSVHTKNFDCFLAIDGGEGVGKSVFAQQVGKYFDPSLCLDRIVFRAKDFVAQVQKALPEQCIVFDEAFAGMSSREHMMTINRILNKLVAEVRQKRLYIILVCPSFFNLDSYAGVWRSRALIHCYLGSGFQRGFFSFFSYEKKKTLFLLGKRLYDYRCVQPDFRGRFSGRYSIDEEAYLKKKLEAFGDYQQLLNVAEDKLKENRKFGCLLYWLAKVKKIPYTEISSAMKQYGVELSRDALTHVVSRYSKNFEGGKYGKTIGDSKEGEAEAIPEAHSGTTDA